MFNPNIPNGAAARVVLEHALGRHICFVLCPAKVITVFVYEQIVRRIF